MYRVENIMRKNIIFSDKELEIMRKRREGDYSYKSAHFALRIKPKIIELIKWFPKLKMLRDLIKDKRGK